MNDNAVAQILDAAADYVEAGWTRLADSDGNVCAEGALNKACFGNPWEDGSADHLPVVHRSLLGAARLALWDVMKNQYSTEIAASGADCDCCCRIITVNDHYANNGAEIATCMRKAAANLRGVLEQFDVSFGGRYDNEERVAYINDVHARSATEISTCMRKAAANLRGAYA